MAKPKTDITRRLAGMRQDNPLVASAPPPAIRCDAPVKNRRVAKNGSIYIAEFEAGIRVNVLRVDPETVVVSSRPEIEVRAIAASIPQAAASPYAALSASLRGRKFELAATRKHSGFTELIRVPEGAEDVVDQLGAQRTKRLR